MMLSKNPRKVPAARKFSQTTAYQASKRKRFSTKNESIFSNRESENHFGKKTDQIRRAKKEMSHMRYSAILNYFT